MKTNGTRQGSLSVIGDAPKRPEDPHQGVGEHKKDCNDQCRPTLLGHEYHWSELLILLLLATVVILAIINSFIEGETKSLQPEHYWIAVLVACSLGSIFLWNIGWVESDASYSRAIDWACKDIEKENSLMAEKMKSLLVNVKQQADLATKASRQTVAMGKKVGVISDNGKVMMENVKKFESVMDSPAFTSYQLRFSRTNKIQKEVNTINKRDNSYNDVIRIFQTSARGGEASSIDLKDKKMLKRLEKAFKNYNLNCKQMGSLPLDSAEFKKMDIDNDGKIALWEFCTSIYHNILRRTLGSEIHKVEEMQGECEKMRQRISQINETIRKHEEGNQAPLEELDDFEINTECLAFAKCEEK